MEDTFIEPLDDSFDEYRSFRLEIMLNLYELNKEVVAFSPHRCADVEDNDHDFARILTGSQYPIFNSVYDFFMPGDDFKEVLESHIEYFEQERVPFTWWWLHKEPPTKEVQKTLLECGYETPGAYSLIALELDSISEPTINPEVKIKAVTTEELYKSYHEILTTTFQTPPDISDDFYHLFYNIHNLSPLLHYVGYLNDKPHSVLTCFHTKYSVGLYCGATLPDAQKNGLLTALISRALIDAKKHGAKFAVAQLMAANMADSIAKSFGVKEYGTIIPYIYGTGVQGLEPGKA